MTGRGLVASSAEKARGQALQDAITHCRQAAAAAAAAAVGHPDPYLQGALREAYDTLRGLERAMQFLAGR